MLTNPKRAWSKRSVINMVREISVNNSSSNYRTETGNDKMLTCNQRGLFEDRARRQERAGRGDYTLVGVEIACFNYSPTGV